MIRRFSQALGALLAVAACSADVDPDVDRTDGVLTWEEFLAEHVTREPWEGGVYIVDYDIPIEDDKLLRDYYESLIADNGLAVAQSRGRDLAWTAADKRNLTYCVSTSFGARYDRVVQAMASAAASWEAVADVDFRHVAAEDGRCTASNTAVRFDVRPVSNTDFLGRAFFPYQSRASSNVLIDTSAFSVRTPSLEGLLRHELGHTLGFRHEHTRPEAGRCREDDSFRGLTPFDRASVMMYPQCGGTNPALNLSPLDGQGAAALYGAPDGAPDPDPEPDPEPEPDPDPGPGTPRTGAASGALAQGQEEHFEGLPVKAGTELRVSITGSGDTDLYVRFGAAPTTRAFDCRPFRADSTEVCTLTVPDGAGTAHVMVRGFTAASFQLQASWTEP